MGRIQNIWPVFNKLLLDAQLIFGLSWKTAYRTTLHVHSGAFWTKRMQKNIDNFRYYVFTMPQCTAFRKGNKTTFENSKGQNMSIFLTLFRLKKAHSVQGSIRAVHSRVWKISRLAARGSRTNLLVIDSDL